jgi:hypothetical protein
MDSSLIAEWVHPAGLACAVVLPMTRAVVRRIRGRSPTFVQAVVVHDVAMGFVAPTFVVLCLSSVVPGVLSVLDPTTALLAGLVGLINLAENLFRPE